MGWKAAVATGLVLVATIAVVRTQLVHVVSVSSDSMAPTVCTGGYVLIKKLHADSPVAVHDIVTFPSPQDGQTVVKRVVGTAGSTVAIEDAELVVDGRKVDEPYVDHDTIDGVYYGPVTVPERSVLVMGDNREVSIDSRTFGPVATSDLQGRVVWVIRKNC